MTEGVITGRVQTHLGRNEMIHVWALLAIVILCISSWGLIKWGADDEYGIARHMFGVIGGGFGLFAAAACSVVYFGMIYNWFAAEQKAKILSREYGVEYTQAEMFFASDVINTVRELDRRRIEINGDFRRERDPQRDLPKPDNR